MYIYIIIYIYILLDITMSGKTAAFMAACFVAVEDLDAGARS